MKYLLVCWMLLSASVFAEENCYVSIEGNGSSAAGSMPCNEVFVPDWKPQEKEPTLDEYTCIVYVEDTTTEVDCRSLREFERDA